MTNENMNFGDIKPSLKDEFCVWSEVGNFSVENDVNEEYILPDYLPDIRKILLVKTSIQNSEIVPFDQKADVLGEIVFNIIYLGDTGEIRSIKQFYDYSGKAVDSAIYEDSVINARTFIKTRSVRAVSPRKILLRAKIGTDMNIYNKLCVSPRLIGSESMEDEFTLERKVNEIDCVNFVKFCEGDIRVSEDIEYSGKLPVGEIIYSDIELYPSDCKHSDGKVNIKGNAKFTALFVLDSVDEEIEYELIERTIPFYKTCAIELPVGDWKISCNLVLGAFECSVANDSYGEPRIFEVDFSATSDVIAITNERTNFTDDAYSTSYEYSNKYKTVNTERMARQGNVNFSVSGVGVLDENDGKTERIVISDADALINSIENKDGKTIFTGDCNMRTVIKTEDNGYINKDFSFPIKYEMQSDGDVGKKIKCNCNVIDYKTRLDTKGINVNAEIGLEYLVFENISANVVETISINKNAPVESKNEKAMFLYYPEMNESLWSISKKYNISPRAIEKANNKLLENELPRVIVIPL